MPDNLTVRSRVFVSCIGCYHTWSLPGEGNPIERRAGVCRQCKTVLDDQASSAVDITCDGHDHGERSVRMSGR